MRIVVFSDTHGNYSAMHKIFMRNRGASLFVFLGDGEFEMAKIKYQYLDAKIVNVRGNCDNDYTIPESVVHKLPDGKKIFITHGHKLAVRYSKNTLVDKAKAAGADIALFGHTHERYIETVDGILLLNPGSAGQPRDGQPACYAWIDVEENGIVTNHVDL